MSISSAVNAAPESGGGIRSSSSFVNKRRFNSLLIGSPGTIARCPSRSAVEEIRSSNRKSACRAAASGPWQWKHLSARIGRTSRLYWTVGTAGVSATTANGSPLFKHANRTMIVRADQPDPCVTVRSGFGKAFTIEVSGDHD